RSDIPLARNARTKVRCGGSSAATQGTARAARRRNGNERFMMNRLWRMGNPLIFFQYKGVPESVKETAGGAPGPATAAGSLQQRIAQPGFCLGNRVISGERGLTMRRTMMLVFLASLAADLPGPL